MQLDQTYFAYYAPLVKEFCDEIAMLPVEQLAKIPQPHLPLFGDRYASSPLKIVIVGRDTRGWGKIAAFIEKGSKDPEGVLKYELEYHREELEFIKYGPTRYTFCGFAMFFLAAIHGINDWQMMKKGKCSNILRSFAMANTNSMVEWGTAQKLGVVPSSFETWSRIKEASNRFDRLSHLVKALKPNVVVLLNSNVDKSSYFSSVACSPVGEMKDGFSHYISDTDNLHILHAPHPTNMKFWGGDTATRFVETFKEVLERYGLVKEFPKFVETGEHSCEILDYLVKHAPTNCDKYDFIAWVAVELSKRESWMAVPALVELLKRCGFKTNRGSEFVYSSHGPYKLIKSTYDRFDGAGETEKAKAVAEAFVKPNGEFAYQEE